MPTQLLANNQGNIHTNTDTKH